MHRWSWVYQQRPGPAPWAVMLEAVGADAIAGISIDAIIYHESLENGQLYFPAIRSHSSSQLAALIEHWMRELELSFTSADFEPLQLTIKSLMEEKGVFDYD